MNSDARRRANRRNAQRSTGPRSAKGKARASCNAIRHGLNTPVRADPVAGALVSEAAAALRTWGGLDPATADRIGELVAHLARVREAKRAAVAATAVHTAPPHAARLTTVEQEAIAICAALPQLLVLESYERKAQSRLRRLLRSL